MIHSPDEKLAVITGAAGGLGSCFAKRLAQQGFRLLLVDRRQDCLEQICDRVTSEYGAEAEPFAANLTDRRQVELLAQRLAGATDLELLVNNAGFGTIEHFVDVDVESHLNMIDVHVVAPMMLTRAALPGMIERDRGAIVNVSSVSAWLLSAGNVQYAATKTYLTAFSLGLHEELRGTNVRIQALCPGFVRTGFHLAASMKNFDACRVPKGYWMSADDVVDCSLRKLTRRQVVVIPGVRYRILGQMMQMPVFKPFFRWGARSKRTAAMEPGIDQLTLAPKERRAANRR